MNTGRDLKTPERVKWVTACNYLRPRVLPGMFIAIGLGLVIYVGIASFSDTPPAPGETTLFVILATVCQVGGATVFGRVGRVDRNHARSAVRRVISVGETVSRARVVLGTSGQSKVTADELLNTATRELENSIQDWNDVYGDALNDVIAERRSSLGVSDG